MFGFRSGVKKSVLLGAVRLWHRLPGGGAIAVTGILELGRCGTEGHGQSARWAEDLRGLFQPNGSMIYAGIGAICLRDQALVLH